MKYLIILLILLLSGCTTTKQLTTSTASTSRSDSVLTVRADSTRVFRDTTTFATTGSAAKDEHVTVVVTEYDTSKPVDYSTGNPPVMRKSYYKSRKSATQSATTTAQASRRDSINVLKSDSTAKSIATNDSAQAAQEIKRSGFPWSLIVIIASVLVMVILARLWISKR